MGSGRPQSTVDALAARVAGLAASADAVIDAADRTAAAYRDRAARDAARRTERALSEFSDRASTGAAQDAAACRALLAALAPGTAGAAWNERLTPVTDLMAVATHVRVGHLLGREPRAGVGVMVPLLDSGNLLVVWDDSETAMAAVHAIVLRALLATGPGQLVLHGYDPALRGLLAPFARLRQMDAGVLDDVATSAADLTDLLLRLTTHVRRVTELRRGRSVTLRGLRAAARQSIEAYHLVVLLDFPRGFARETASTLGSLLRAGPGSGVSFLIHQAATGAVDPELDADTVEREAEVIRVDRGGAIWSRLGDAPIALDTPPAARVVAAAVDSLAELLSAASVPYVDVAEIIGSSGRTGSTADGIVVPIGRTGTEIVELTIGDGRSQRHNVLVTGAVGQGKSNFLKILIHSLASRYEPTELSLYLVDLKEGVTFFPLTSTSDSPDWLPHAVVVGVESDREFAVAVLEHLFREFERRSATIKPYGDNIAGYRAAVRGAVMPRIVLIMDEFHVLFEGKDSVSERAVDLLEKLSRRGRSAGIHLVLASQTISGIQELLGRENGIYSQFPIRVAFKNSLMESRAVLSESNTGAAELRFRGEAVLNLNLGIPPNSRVVVAAGDDDQLRGIRRTLWQRRPVGSKPPAVFDGGHPAGLDHAIDTLRGLRAEIGRGARSGRLALLGVPVALPLTADGVVLARDAGRHVAILGAPARRPRGESSTPDNLAVGAIQSAAVSLAVQHPKGDADFVLLDLFSADEAVHAGMADFYGLMERLGFPVRVVGPADIGQELRAIASSLQSGPTDPLTRYVLAPAFDRAGNLSTVDDTFRSDADALRSLVREGPVRGTHLLGWWSSVGVFKSQLGLDPTVEIDGLLALRVPQRDVTDLMGYTVTWEARDNRGLLYDRQDFTEPVTIVPMGSMTTPLAQMLARVDWDVHG